ncbi:hypothetical protein GALMADRAFT_1218112 [Galerina marginata CBS 339.88]|uniref:DUF7330 domain-containing protein n=1 Tax=Galerina marginata (strain CBS 339.88) TaxID=685588 RepID=A0A067SDE3_GALM3|nr:hypothetical protein GALMADRAFT_1218112 [Galerina marginata CBS 339.88]
MPVITRRNVRRPDQPLQVVNHRDSAGVDSLSSGAPPPCYTSQKEVPSSVATSDGTRSINPSEDDDSDDHGSVESMHSCHDILPSPYSTEDLFAEVADALRVQDHTYPAAPSSTHTQSCIHGYTHTHSQCTIDMPPAIYDSHTSATHSPAQTRSIHTFPNQQPTNPYPYIYQGRSARYSSTPTTPYGSHRGLPRAPEASSPRSILYHHRPSSQPAAIGHLTYRPLKSSYELHLEPDELFINDGEHAAQAHTPIEDSSTMTFVPDDGYSSGSHYRNVPPRRGHSSLATSYVPIQKEVAPAPPPTQSRATNYVSLSRKSTLKKSSFFGPSSTPSSITGDFTIDPNLYIPPALLKAIEPLPLSSPHLSGVGSKSDTNSPSGLSYKPFSKGRRLSTGPKLPRKNLRLEVENGGIDIDVHLVPSTDQSAQTRDATARNSSSNVLSSASRHYQESRVRPCLGRRPSSRRSQVAQGYDSPVERESGPGASSKLLSSPTLIELRLKQSRPASSRRTKDFPLVARIHAPSPRPPFHLLASTIDVPGSDITPNLSDSSSSTSTIVIDRTKSDRDQPLPPTSASSSPANASNSNTPSSFAGTGTGTNLLTTNPAPPRHRGSTSGGVRRPLSKSQLTLHIPRNFRGPLSVHVAAGNIDEHVRLSKEVTGAVVVLSESAFSRGYYIGGLASPEEGEEAAYNEGTGEDGAVNQVTSRREEVPRNGLDGGERDATDELYKIDRAKHLSTGVQRDDDNNSEQGKDDEWHGDKVDVVVGEGKFYLQFVDEPDPFSKKGSFWKNFILGRR